MSDIELEVFHYNRVHRALQAYNSYTWSDVFFDFISGTDYYGNCYKDLAWNYDRAVEALRYKEPSQKTLELLAEVQRIIEETERCKH